MELQSMVVARDGEEDREGAKRNHVRQSECDQDCDT